MGTAENKVIAQRRIDLPPRQASRRSGGSPTTPGFVLQSTDGLAPTNWVNAPSGTSNPATVPATLPARFYRLFKP